MHLPRPFLPLALVVAFPLASPRTAQAWSAKTQEQVAEQAARLMPESLKFVLAQNKARLLQGAVAPMGAAAGDEYLREDATSAELEGAVQTQAQHVLDLLTQRAPLSTVAYEMGVLSYDVSLAQNPVNDSADDPSESQWAPDFQAFVESRLPKFRIVFDGYLAEPLGRDDVRGFVRQARERGRRYYPILAESYHQPDGKPLHGSPFDDKHPVFGIASLAYAHSVGDTAKIWLYLWIRANGDTTGLPYPQALQPGTLTQVSGQ